jgi:hypothetical protein
MLLAHYAVALGAKRLAPAVSLGTLILAAQFLDLIWPLLLLSGFEQVRIDPGNTAVTPLEFVSYPISHSLVAVIGWGVLLGGGWWLVRRELRGALVIGLLVVSHWFLDALAHAPDLPIFPGGDTRVGLGLWNSLPATIVVECSLLAIGLWVYTRVTEPLDRAGRWGLWAMVGVLVVIFLANLSGGVPPGETEIAVVTLGLWLFVAWGYWIDRHRRRRDT